MAVPSAEHPLEEDTYALLTKRVFDVAATTDKSLKV